MNRGIVSFCDNCLRETPHHELEHLALDGHHDNRSIFSPRWIEACRACVPQVTAHGYRPTTRGTATG